ncbi:MAG: 1-acyl-sn-glycerol-3-phosphate acyltransferase [Betaproteobacteria bacterium]|nr:1-acyl-sn-glycerol-3-phosphate acyltransferase [Betaproteobacteria bacterium]MDH3437351.1 1-acyl-sn-glycerol-3-phosphate acyltransferase [Betaproteobacteria bacterium]
MSVVIRSSLLALFQALITPPFALLALLTFPLTPLIRYRLISAWSRLIVAGAEKICGIRYRVLGADHIPSPPYIVLAKHQSAWETLAFQTIFPPHTWVVKRELLWIPFFGWGLAMLSPIAIDRAAGARALRQLLDQGRERLARGLCIVMFPEGTRMPPGARGSYQAGGAWLATQTATRVLPVAHNAGTLWRRKAFLKYPGLITVSVGDPIDPQGLTHQELNRRVEDWIETEMQRLDD